MLGMNLFASLSSCRRFSWHFIRYPIVSFYFCRLTIDASMLTTQVLLVTPLTLEKEHIVHVVYLWKLGKCVGESLYYWESKFVGLLLWVRCPVLIQSKWCSQSKGERHSYMYSTWNRRGGLQGWRISTANRDNHWFILLWIWGIIKILVSSGTMLCLHLTAPIVFSPCLHFIHLLDSYTKLYNYNCKQKEIMLYIYV